MHFRVLLMNFVPAHVILFSSHSLFAQVSYPYNALGNVNLLCVFSLMCCWTLEVFKALLIILVILRNFDILTGVSFSFWYEIKMCAGIAHPLRAAAHSR